MKRTTNGFVFGRRDLIRTTILFPAAALAAVLATGCKPSNEFKAPPPPAVTVSLPVEKELIDYVETTGTTEAVDSVELRARVNGYLEKILFEDGAVVKEGDLLFVIEKAPFEAALAAREAAVARAQASVKLAELESGRAERLSKSNAVATGEVQRREAELSTAKADLASAQASLTQSKLDFAYTEIRAPFSGRMGRHLVDRGNLVQSAQTVLGMIQRDQPIYAYFYVSELEFLGLQERMKQGGENKVIPISLSTMDDKTFSHTGRLDFEAPAVERETGTIQWRGVFENANRELLPGLFVRVRASVGDPKKTLLVPDEAVASDQRGTYMLVVKSDDTVERRAVVLGPVREGLRVVREGIQLTDRVITSGLQKSRPGAKVQVQTAGQPPAQAAGAPAAPPQSSSAPQSQPGKAGV